MDSIRTSARRRGLRAAAQVAAITGLVAASAALGHAEPARGGPSASDGSPGASAGDGSGEGVVDRVTDAIRVRQSSGGCGCAPCWGPPAPPAMREELFEGDEELPS
jgi:hypothetical protein